MTEGLLEAAAPPRPPTSLSPSRYATLLECPLRYAWEVGNEPPRLPGSRGARLGTVIHRLFERAERGGLPPDPAALKAAWREEVGRAEKAMTGSWLERPFVPLRRRLAAFEEKRLLALERAERLAAEAARARVGGRSGGGLPPEAVLVADGGKVRGRLDRVFLAPEGPVIRDHKSGRTHDEETGALAERHRLQLQLYAALYAKARQGAWPVRLEVVDLRGAATEVPFEPAACEALLGEALGRVDRLARDAEAVREGRVALETLATPGEAACRYCPYRPVCPGYRAWARTAERPPDAGWRDAWGAVRGLRRDRQGQVTLELDGGGEAVRVQRLDASPGRNPALQGLEEGAEAAVFNLGRNVGGGAYLAGDYTVVYRCQGRPERPPVVQGAPCSPRSPPNCSARSAAPSTSPSLSKYARARSG